MGPGEGRRRVVGAREEAATAALVPETRREEGHCRRLVGAGEEARHCLLVGAGEAAAAALRPGRRPAATTWYRGGGPPPWPGAERRAAAAWLVPKRRVAAAAEGLKKIEQFTVDPASVETNMVFFDTLDPRITPDKLCQALEERNVLAMPASSTSIRFVLHYQISDSDIQYALTCVEEAVEELLNDSTVEELLNDSTEFEL
ncbi:hypothetical protein U9M48_033188 [Paspalum notatum var. saurae]|uniref:Uncharacterized protein n=1 Tax=Paspalum notatum var. saurae TaxID=547442 RepID=A0AAQ3U6W0_PASNO